jgi:FdrA protein
MSVIVNRVRRGFYLDSVALMRLSREIGALDGVEQAGLMMGTPSNKEILAAAGLLGPEGQAAAPGDLVLAVRARDTQAAKAAGDKATLLLESPRVVAAAGSSGRPRSLEAAAKAMPAANLALVSVPGEFAATEGRRALAAGLNVMIFSDNVPIEEEARLKREAAAKGLLVMGPDCGTAIINGVPLAFANRVRRGEVGIVGASGTGIQEVSTLVDRLGKGISHAIGTGGRDLKAEVGGITTLAAIDLLEADPRTRHVVVISKPPAADVAARVIERIGRSDKTFTVAFLGSPPLSLPRNAKQAQTLEEAAEIATGLTTARLAPTVVRSAPLRKARKVRGLFSGGTLCAEAQVILSSAGIDFASNVPIPGARKADGADGNLLIDLGEDEFTRGRPHPMIEPSVRDAPLLEAMADPSVDAVLLDVVLGLGGHTAPGTHLAKVVSGARGRRPYLVASITGTAADPQGLEAETAALVAAGIVVTASAADAARRIVQALKS